MAILSQVDGQYAAAYQHFDPFNIHLSPFFSALLRMLTTSDPALGSDIAREPMCSPESRGGR